MHLRIFTHQNLLKLGIIAAIFFLALVTNIAYSQTPWSNPPAPPTAGNTSAPINEGPVNQVKSGSFGVTRTLTAKYLDAQPQVDGAGNEFAGEGGELRLRGQGGWNDMVVDNQAGRFRVWNANTSLEALIVDPDRTTFAPAGLRAHHISIGTCKYFGACPYPYETISMHPGHNLRIHFGGTERFAFTNDGTLWARVVRANSFIYSSDERLKTKIQTAPGMSVVNQLRGVSFDWKESGDSSYGLIAQEVEQVMPELVHEDDEGMKSVEYAQIIAVLIEGMKEQDERIAEQNSRIEELERQVGELTN